MNGGVEAIPSRSGTSHTEEKRLEVTPPSRFSMWLQTGSTDADSAIELLLFWVLEIL